MKVIKYFIEDKKDTDTLLNFNIKIKVVVENYQSFYLDGCMLYHPDKYLIYASMQVYYSIFSM